MSSKRKPPVLRSHEDYFDGHWVLTHIKDVDMTFAAASHGKKSDEDKIRLDIDGFGATAATAHDEGDNVNTSIWLDPEDAKKLTEQIDEAIADGHDRVWAESE
jgi:hypothetical protein